MELRAALDAAIQQLEQNGVGSTRRNAESLMMFTLGVDRAYLYAHPERELTPDEQNRYQQALAERSTGRPLQYITGHQEFWGLDLLVSPAVLIPRPETEHVVETVLQIVPDKSRPLRIVDVGTGSGCIAVAVASELPHAEVHAVDISSEALEVARTNAARLNLDGRVRFGVSDLLDAFAEEQETFDLVLSNPPYVSYGEADKVQRGVKEFEPHVAIFGGEHGLDIYKRLIPQSLRVLKPGGWLVMEIGYSIGEALRALMTEFREFRVTTDLQGLPRVVSGRKKAR